MAQRFLVVGIDIGTAYSGYAYSFKSDFKENPLHVTANNWVKEGADNDCQKVPTTTLLTPSGEFDSFGFEAENKYAKLTEKGEHHGWYYFKNFKMKLMGQVSVLNV